MLSVSFSVKRLMLEFSRTFVFIDEMLQMGL